MIPEFGADDYAQEIKVSGTAARGNLNRSLTLDRMPPACGWLTTVR